MMMLTIISPWNIISATRVNKSLNQWVLHLGLTFSYPNKLTLSYTLIYPYIVYCNSAWSSTYVSNLNRIYHLKRNVRTITNLNYGAHSAPLFSKLGILDIFHVNTVEITKFIFS